MSRGTGRSTTRANLGHLLRRIYPQGLQCRSVLDLACNNGAYLFAAKDDGT